MNRRAFLKWAGAGAVGAAVAHVASSAGIDPEMLGWEKGARTFFIPENAGKVAIATDQQATDQQSGIAVRWLKEYEVDSPSPTHVDVLFGYGRLTPGDVITIDGLKSFNPLIGKYADFDQQFVITANVESSGYTVSVPIEHVLPSPLGRDFIKQMRDRKPLTGKPAGVGGSPVPVNKLVQQYKEGRIGMHIGYDRYDTQKLNTYPGLKISDYKEGLKW